MLFNNMFGSMELHHHFLCYLLLDMFVELEVVDDGQQAQEEHGEEDEDG